MTWDQRTDQGNPLGGNTLVRWTIEYTIPVIERVRFAMFLRWWFC